MANDVRNILVGAANLYISLADTKATIPATAAGTSYATTMDATNTFKQMGLTTGGVELSYAPNYGDVTVDQLLDAARLFKQSMTVNVRTTLSEGTLENLNLALGQSTDQFSVINSGVSSETTLKIGGDQLGEAPVERSLVFVGQAPYFMTKTGVTSLVSTSTKKERVYIARRVVQMETVAHALKRDGATEFPVNFRCLPDVDFASDNSEYGKIIDRVYG